ncbi:MAG TPA: ABC transporter permease [Stellaceae bacterium]|nr:ABC transporter permease [Stellaceae bacterium]
MNRRISRLVLGIPAVLLLIAFVVVPYIEMLTMSLRMPGSGMPYGVGFTLGNFGHALGDPLYRGALARSLMLGAVVAALCLLLSYPVALHLARVSDRWHLVFYVCVVSPLLVGVLVRNFGWMIILAVDGPLNRLLLTVGLIDTPLRMLFNQGVVILALVHVFVPFMVLPITNALRNIDGALVEASASLGASDTRTFWRITFPLSFPGVQAALVLVFVLASSAYVTPALLGGQAVALLPSLIVDQLIGALAWPFGAALAIVLAAAMSLVVLAFTALSRPLAERTST